MTVSEIAKAVTGNVIATKTVKVENDKRSQYPLKKTSDIQYWCHCLTMALAEKVNQKLFDMLQAIGFLMI
nr:hypothetical protein [Providencia alcalifaciens]